MSGSVCVCVCVSGSVLDENSSLLKKNQKEKREEQL